MKNILFVLFFAFLSIALSNTSFSAEKKKTEKIHITGKTTLDSKPYPETDLYLQREDWIDGQEVLSHKKIGKSGKDGVFSLAFKRNVRQGQKIIAIKQKEAVGWIWVIPQTINESAEIKMFPLNSSFTGYCKGQ